MADKKFDRVGRGDVGSLLGLAFGVWRLGFGVVVLFAMPFMSPGISGTGEWYMRVTG